MPFCRECGSSIELSWKFCPNCNIKLPVTETKPNEISQSINDSVVSDSFNNTYTQKFSEDYVSKTIYNHDPTAIIDAFLRGQNHNNISHSQDENRLDEGNEKPLNEIIPTNEITDQQSFDARINTYEIELFIKTALSANIGNVNITCSNKEITLNAVNDSHTVMIACTNNAFKLRERNWFKIDLNLLQKVLHEQLQEFKKIITRDYLNWAENRLSELGHDTESQRRKLDLYYKGKRNTSDKFGDVISSEYLDWIESELSKIGEDVVKRMRDFELKGSSAFTEFKLTEKHVSISFQDSSRTTSLQIMREVGKPTSIGSWSSGPMVRFACAELLQLIDNYPQKVICFHLTNEGVLFVRFKSSSSIQGGAEEGWGEWNQILSSKSQTSNESYQATFNPTYFKDVLRYWKNAEIAMEFGSNSPCIMTFGADDFSIVTYIAPIFED